MLEVTQQVEGRDNPSLLTPAPGPFSQHSTQSALGPSPFLLPSLPSHTLGPALPPSVTEAAGTASFSCPLGDEQRRGPRRGPPRSTQGEEPRRICLRWGQCRGSFSASTYGTIDGRGAHQTRDKP